MHSVVLFILSSRLLLYSAGSGVQVVLSGFSDFMFCTGKNFMYVWVYEFLATLVLVGVDVIVMSSA